jgi:hypothetical protein
MASKNEPVSTAILAAFKLLVLFVAASAPVYPLLILGPNILHRPLIETLYSFEDGVVVFAACSVPAAAGCLVVLLLMAQRGKASLLSVFLNRIAFIWYLPLGLVLGVILGAFFYYRFGPQPL